LNSDFDYLLPSFPSIELQGTLGIRATIAYALDVLPVEMNLIEGMVTKVWQAS